MISLIIINKNGSIVFFFTFFWAVLEFELGASQLLGRCSTLEPPPQAQAYLLEDRTNNALHFAA
jgi:hypothetical protein